jgi:hypothetical protein
MPPEIDPITGLPIVPPDDKTPNPDILQIKKEDWDKLNARLDSFDLHGAGNQFQQTQQAPAGPSIDDQLSAIDRQIDAFDAEIDQAVKDGDPVSKLLKQRDTLSRKYTRLEIKLRDIDPAMGEGIEVIGKISSEMARGKMPHYELVKNDMAKHLNGIPANQRMNPDVQQAAYNMAAGANLDKILAAEREKLLRADIADPTKTGLNQSTKNKGKSSGGAPDPKSVLSRGAMDALELKGITVDQHYQKLGHKDWADFWEKKGKAHFGNPDED